MALRQIFIAMVIGCLFTSNMIFAQNRPYSESENNQATYELLENNVSVEFFETKFGDVVEQLQEESGLTFWLDESAQDNNLDNDSLITAALPDTRLATVLKFILEPFQCTWCVQDGFVRILSEDVALDNLSLRVVDCSDLLANIKPRTITRRVTGSRRGSGGGGFGGGGGVFTVPVRSDATDEDQEKTTAAQSTPPVSTIPATMTYTMSSHEQLLRLITGKVDPDSWEENGGSASVETVNDVLVIRQTEENLRDVRNLLQALRSADLGK